MYSNSSSCEHVYTVGVMLQVVHASTQGCPAMPEAALTVNSCGMTVSMMALLQRPDPRAPLLLLPAASVAARQAAGDGCRGAVQTALAMYLHQRACCEPLAVRALPLRPWHFAELGHA